MPLHLARVPQETRESRAEAIHPESTTHVGRRRRNQDLGTLDQIQGICSSEMDETREIHGT